MDWPPVAAATGPARHLADAVAVFEHARIISPDAIGFGDGKSAVRVLFTGVVGFGHFNPMVPLARAFVDGRSRGPVRHRSGLLPNGRGDRVHGLPGRSRSSRGARSVSRDDAGLGRDPAGRPGHRYLSPRHVRSGPRAADARRPGADPRTMAARAADPRQRRDGRRDRRRGGRASRTSNTASACCGRSRSGRRPRTSVAPISAAAGVRNPGVGGLGGEPYLDVCPPRLQFPDISSVPNVIRLRPVEIEEPPRLRVRGVARPPGRSSDRLSHDGHRLQRDGTPAVDRRRHRRPRRRRRGHARPGRRPVDRGRPAGARPRGVVHPAGGRSSAGAG